MNDILIATCPECGSPILQFQDTTDFKCQKCGTLCAAETLGLKSPSEFNGGEKVHFSICCDLTAEQDTILRTILAQWGIDLSKPKK